MQIFLSYAQEDRTIYSELCKMLLAAGQSYWDADSMPLGAMLQDKLREGIRACDACLFVATQHSIASKWCLAELGAFWGAGKPVIPYIADPAINEGQLPPYLQGLVWTSDAREAVKQANAIAMKQHWKFPAVTFDTLESDGDAVPRILQVLTENRGKFTTARLIQYSGEYIYPILQTLTSWNVQVQLLLMHPAQVLRDPNYPVINLQLSKLKNFHLKPDLGPTLEIKYYLHPASLRGLAVPDVICALGWYTHEAHWLYGHRNTTVIAHGADIAKTALWNTFDRVFTAMWQDAVARHEDKSNIERLLNLEVSPPGRKLRLPGIVIRGYGVASGANCQGGPGTLARQAEVLSEKIDWHKFFQGTINVSIAPKAFAWRESSPNIGPGPVRWSNDQAPEEFCLAPCQLEANGAVCDAWVYYPHPRTKSQNFHSPSTVEVIAPHIDGIQYGSTVAVYLDTSSFAVW